MSNQVSDRIELISVAEALDILNRGGTIHVADSGAEVDEFEPINLNSFEPEDCEEYRLRQFLRDKEIRK